MVGGRASRQSVSAQSSVACARGRREGPTVSCQLSQSNYTPRDADRGHSRAGLIGMKTFLTVSSVAFAFALYTAAAAGAHDTCPSSCTPSTSASVGHAKGAFVLTITVNNTCNKSVTFEACPDGGKGRCGKGVIPAGESRRVTATSSAPEGKVKYHWHCR